MSTGGDFACCSSSIGQPCAHKREPSPPKPLSVDELAELTNALDDAAGYRAPDRSSCFDCGWVACSGGGNEREPMCADHQADQETAKRYQALKLRVEEVISAMDGFSACSGRPEPPELTDAKKAAALVDEGLADDAEDAYAQLIDMREVDDDGYDRNGASDGRGHTYTDAEGGL